MKAQIKSKLLAQLSGLMRFPRKTVIVCNDPVVRWAESRDLIRIISATQIEWTNSAPSFFGF